MKNFLLRLGTSVLFILHIPVIVYLFVIGIIGFCCIQNGNMAWAWMYMIKDVIGSEIKFIRTLDFGNFKENLVLSFGVLNVEEKES